MGEPHPPLLAIAERVAQGHTNRKVAADLFVSPHTSDAQLRHIYAKVGITSRVQLTRVVIANSETDNLDASEVA
jgi:DNA-binding CsgD family transcriptional regulator